MLITIRFQCNGRSWFVRWCSQGQMYLEFRCNCCILQIGIFCRSFFFLEPVFFPNVGICQSRQIVNIFPSDSRKTKIFTCNLDAIVVFYRLWYFADPLSCWTGIRSRCRSLPKSCQIANILPSDLELVSKELNHFGVIADLFRQIGAIVVDLCYFALFEDFSL